MDCPNEVVHHSVLSLMYIAHESEESFVKRLQNVKDTRTNKKTTIKKTRKNKKKTRVYLGYKVMFSEGLFFFSSCFIFLTLFPNEVG